MKTKTIITIIASLVSLAVLSIAARSYYLDHVKYKVLEKEIRQVHQEMEKDLPKELKQNGDFQKTITEYSFPNSYGVGDDGSEITKEFEKAGIVPEDQWVIVKETFIRWKIGAPFRLNRLIKLTNDAYKTKGERKTLRAISDEFYVYKEFKGKIDK
jgi:hypothetical protein